MIQRHRSAFSLLLLSLASSACSDGDKPSTAVGHHAVTVALTPTSQSIDEGQAAGWSGTIEIDEATEGVPTSLSWDFSSNGSADQVLCDDDDATDPAECDDARCVRHVLGEPVAYDCGQGARDPLVVDLDGDGNLDTIVPSYGDSSLSVRLGDGAGALGAETRVGTAGSPTDVAIGDVDGDADLDLVVSTSGGQVSLLRNDGTGAYVRSDVTIGGNLVALRLLDATGDGDLDVVVVDQSTSTARLLIGDGGGGFLQDTGGTLTGARPSDVALADLNGDGRRDVIVANRNNNSVSVFLGDGAGGLSGRTDTSLPINPTSLLVDDVNGDGRSDLLVTGNSSLVVELLGNGTGGWTQRNLSFGSVRSVALGDIDGDNIRDLILSDRSIGGVTIALGDGTGDFGILPSASAPYGNWTTAVADMNGDGHDDVVVGSNSGISVFTGNGAGGFSGRTDVGGVTRARAIAVGDVDGDGDPDVITGNRTSSFSVFRNDGVAGFARADYGVASNVHGIVVRDIDADTDLDVVVATRSSNGITIYRGDGTGTFSSRADLFTSAGMFDVDVADVDGDGAIDIVATGDSYTLAFHNDDNTYTFSETLASSGGREVEARDVDADGDVDLCVMGHGSGSLGWLRNGGSGTFARTDIQFGLGMEVFTFGDIEGDGDLDLVAAGGGYVSVIRASAPGTFGAPVVSNAAFGSARAIALGDLDEDGDLDPWVGSRGGGTLPILSMSDSGHVSARRSYRTGYSGMHGVVAADFDGDGDTDVAVAARQHSQLSVFLNGGGFLGAPTSLSTPNPGALVAADVTGDGELDLVAASRHNHILSMFAGVGDGTFASRVDVPTVPGAQEMKVADANGDGILDVLVGSRDSARVAVHDGASRLAFRVETWAANYETRIAVGDLDGDGIADAAVTNAGQNRLQLLHGYGDGTFGNRPAFGVGPNPQALATGDLDGDGRMDAAVASNGTSSMIVLHGGARGFDAGQLLPFAASQLDVAIGDLNGDGHADVVAGLSNATLARSLGDGTGALGAVTAVTLPIVATQVAIGDIDGDAHMDVAAGSSGWAMLAIAFGDASGGVASVGAEELGETATGLATANLDGDASRDLVVARYDDVAVLLDDAPRWTCALDTTSDPYLDSKGGGAGPQATFTATATLTTTSGSFTAAGAVTVGDVAPSVFVIDHTPITAEGDFVSIVYGWGDPSPLDAFVVTIDWGDGQQTTQNVAAGTYAGSAVHRYVDEGDYTATVRVADDEGQSTTDSRGVLIADSPPAILGVLTNAPVPVGSAATVWTILSSTTGDSYTYDFDWNGDGDYDDAGIDVVGAATAQAAFTSATAGARTVHVRVHDDEDNTVEGEVSVAWLTTSTTNHEPGAPSIDAPGAGTEVATATPTLSVTNATDEDGDTLTYTFELDTTPSFATAQRSGAIAEGAGTTSFTTATLDEGTTYWWRARASDGLAAGDWVVGSFRVDAVDDAPGAPLVLAPSGGAVVSPRPRLLAANATDPDGDTLTYVFEVRTISSDTIVAGGAGVAVGAGQHAFDVDVDLAAGAYRWTARATDGGGNTGADAVEGLFTVDDGTTDPSNTEPGAPTLVGPADGAVVDTTTPTLEIGAATDGDGDALTYVFELDVSPTFSSAARQASGPVTATTFTVAALDEDTTYFWRARATDGVAFGDWVLGTFRVDAANALPGRPTLVSPIGGVAVATTRPQLVIGAATDVDSDELTYSYSVYDEDNNVVAEGEGTPGQTTFTLEAPLEAGHTYVWTARATDGDGATGLDAEEGTFTILGATGDGGCNAGGQGGGLLPLLGIGLALALRRRRR